jgi:succinate-semialdehyde dehydrogenase/glutarate-semialdehyde dehydrogenase
MGPQEVGAVVARARAAQAAWGALPVKERCRQLRAFTKLLYEESDRVADLLTLEAGKPRMECWTTEIVNVLDLAHYFLRRAPSLLAPRSVRPHLLLHRGSTLHYAPRPVTAIIGPWNFPHMLNLAPAVMAWITGSAVVIKPSEATPLITLLGKEIWDRSGLPADLFGVVTGFGPTGGALVEAGVDQVVFTGSVNTGRRVAEACARQLIPCILELGGKAPCVVLPDADLERTARGIAWTGFCNSGQVCASIERVYAHESIHDELLRRVVVEVGALKQGDPREEDTQIGPIIFPRQLEVAESQVADAVAKGAKVELGGLRRPGPGQFFQPTVLSGVDHGMKVAKEETFGPIVPFLKWRDEDEVLAHANDSHLGLLAYVYTRDVAHGRRVARRIQAGTVVINDGMLTNGMPETPWHGVKKSGLGKVHSDDGLRDLCELRHINHNRLPALSSEPYWYPYTAGRLNLWRRLAALLFSGRPWTALGPPPDLPPADARSVLPKGALPLD